MKKIIISIITLGLLIIIYVMPDNRNNSNKVEDDIHPQVSLITNDIVMQDNKDKSDTLKQLKDLVETNKNASVVEKTKKILEVQLDCIQAKTCLQDQNARFYDSKLDPAFNVVEKSLELLNQVTLDDEAKLTQIETAKLLEVVKLQHIQSSFLAYSLLLRKGVDEFLQTGSTAYSLTGEGAVTYLRQFKNPQLFENQQALKLRDNLIKNYLNQQDNDTSFEVLKEIEKHSLSENLVSDVLEISCQKFKPFSTESKQIVKLQLEQLARSINRESACQ